jgi:hypothetical protein
MSLRRTIAIFACFIILGACSKGAAEDAEATHTHTLPPSAPPAKSGEAASSKVTRPQPGVYVYDFVGQGETTVPAGTQITESITVKGNVYTVDVSTNRNANQQSYQLRWSSDRVLQLDNETVIGGTRGSCPYNPPLDVLHLPVRAEHFKSQETGVAACRERFDIEVFNREMVQDATGHPWAAWIIQVRTETNDRTKEETHWFAPKLGRDIRVEVTEDTTTAHRETAQILRSYPK